MSWQDDEVVQSGWHADPVVSSKTKPGVPGALQSAAINAGAWVDRKAAGLRDLVPAPIRSAVDTLNDKLGMGPVPRSEDLPDREKALAPVQAAHPVASFIGGAAPDLAVINPVSMAALAALDPGTAGQRALRAGETFAVGKAGQKVGGFLADRFANRAAAQTVDLAAQKVENAARDKTVNDALALGLKLPPTMVNPNAVTRGLEGFSGKAQTGQALALENERMLPQIMKRELGLPQSVPLNRDTLEQVRGVAGKAYETLKGFGPLTADDAFRADVGKFAGEYQSLAQNFPSQKVAKIDTLLEDLNKPGFNSSDAVQLVRRLRYDGFRNVKSPDPETAALGHIQLGAQNALEDLIDRNLQAAGQGDFLQVFRNARTTIAKSHTIENALEESTGKIVGAKIGREFSKGRPLTGDLATVGRAAEAFPKAFQNVNSSMPGVSPLDYAAGLIGAIGTGNPAAAAIPLARPAVRAGLLSGPFQRALAPSYEKGLAGKLLEKAGNSREEMQKLGGLLGILGLRAYQ